MYSDILKSLKKDGSVLKGSVDFNGRSVSVRLDPDDASVAETAALAEKFLVGLDHYHKAALEIICARYLHIYNEDWREEDAPVLTAEELSELLILDSINFLSRDSVDFFFNDSDLFAGHSLISQSFDGETFEHVQMFG